MPEIAAGLTAHLFSTGELISSSRIAAMLSFPHPWLELGMPGRSIRWADFPDSRCVSFTVRSPTQVWAISRVISKSTMIRESLI